MLVELRRSRISKRAVKEMNPPEPIKTPKSICDTILEKVGPQTPEHWKGVVDDYNNKQAIKEPEVSYD